MTVSSLDQLIQRLPPGRARARYERLASSLGEAIAVTLPYLDEPLWLVLDAPAAGTLTSKGIPRWRIWTLGELQDLFGAFGTPVKTLAEAAETLQVTAH